MRGLLKNSKPLLLLVAVVSMLSVTGCFGGVSMRLAGNWSGPLEQDGYIYAIGNGLAERIDAETRVWDQARWQPNLGGDNFGAVYGTLVSDGIKIYGAGYGCDNDGCTATIFGIPTDPKNETNIRRTTVNAKIVGQLALLDDTILVASGRPAGTEANAGVLYAYEKDNLNPVGRLNFDGELLGGITVVGTTAFLGSMAGKVYAVDVGNPLAMRVIWEYSTGAAVAAKPVVQDGTLYIGTFAKEDNFIALGASNGQLQWSSSSGAWIWAEAVLSTNGEVVYSADFDGNINALNSTTGLPAWSQAAEIGGTVVARPALVSANGRNYLAVPNQVGDIHVVDADSGRVTGEVLSTGGGVAAPPLVFGEQIHVMTLRGQLLSFSTTTLSQSQCLDIPNGSLRCS